jgi:hypothetical protein
MNHVPESFIVIPAEAGIQDFWTPAFAGVTCRNPLPYLRNGVLSTGFPKFGRTFFLDFNRVTRYFANP